VGQRMQQLADYIDGQRGLLREAVDRVPPGLRQRRKDPDRWSAAEIVEHVALVEARITATLDAKLAEAGDLPLEQVGGSVQEMFDVARVVDRGRRFKTGEASEPKSVVSADSAWTKLDGTRRRLLELMRRCDGLNVSAITHPHPVFGPLNLYQWVAFVGAHDARHAAQIDEMELGSGPA
jgi:hypothetical protein